MLESFLDNVADLVSNFIKKETLAQVFFCEFREILRTLFLIEHIQWLLLFVLLIATPQFGFIAPYV